MKLRLLSVFLLIAMLASILIACGGKEISAEEGRRLHCARRDSGPAPMRCAGSRRRADSLMVECRQSYAVWRTYCQNGDESFQ